MTKGPTACQQCGGALPTVKGRGRPRVYCSPACRNAAYETRRDAAPRPTIPVRDAPGQQRPWTQHSDLQTCVDLIVDSPGATHDLMNQFLVRVALGLILEDVRYQPAVSSLVTAFRMIARITDGDFKLPKVRD